MKYLHDNKIMHRDLKCANIFLMKNGMIKIGDLNVSKISKMVMAQTQTGTQYYCAPEIWKVNRMIINVIYGVWDVLYMKFVLIKFKYVYERFKDLDNNDNNINDNDKIILMIILIVKIIVIMIIIMIIIVKIKIMIIMIIIIILMIILMIIIIFIKITNQSIFVNQKIKIKKLLQYIKTTFSWHIFKRPLHQHSPRYIPTNKPNIFIRFKKFNKKHINSSPRRRPNSQMLLNSEIIQKKIKESKSKVIQVVENNKNQKASLIQTIRMPININDINKKLPKKDIKILKDK